MKPKNMQNETTERLKEARAVTIKLAAYLEALGKAFNDFGYALQHPDDRVFEVTDENITVGREKKTDAYVTKSQMDWEALIEDLRTYIRARNDVRMIEAQLRGQGIIS